MRDGVGGLFIFQSIVRLLFHHLRVIFKIVREYVVPYKETGGACSLKGNNDHIHDFALGKMRRGDHDLTVKNGLNLASSISLLSLSLLLSRSPIEKPEIQVLSLSPSLEPAAYRTKVKGADTKWEPQKWMRGIGGDSSPPCKPC